MKIHSGSLRRLNGIDYIGAICPTEVPDSMLNEQWAYKIHGQTLHRLNERGGMSVSEILANIKKLPFDQIKVDTVQMAAELKMLIESHTNDSNITIPSPHPNT